MGTLHTLSYGGVPVHLDGRVDIHFKTAWACSRFADHREQQQGEKKKKNEIKLTRDAECAACSGSTIYTVHTVRQRRNRNNEQLKFHTS